MRPAENTRIWRKTRRAAMKGLGRGRRWTHPVRTVVGRRRRHEAAVYALLRAAAEMPAHPATPRLITDLKQEAPADAAARADRTAPTT